MKIEVNAKELEQIEFALNRTLTELRESAGRVEKVYREDLGTTSAGVSESRRRRLDSMQREIVLTEDALKACKDATE